MSVSRISSYEIDGQVCKLCTTYCIFAESRIDTAMDGKNIIRKRSAQAEENIASYVHLSEIRLCFPTKDWKKYVTDKEIIDKMSKTREEVKKKLDRVIKLMPKKKVVTYEIDFKNCAGYTPSPLEI